MGSGDANVNAVDVLEVSSAGSGDVRYAGMPKVKHSVAGSGTVKSLQQTASSRAPARIGISADARFSLVVIPAVRRLESGRFFLGSPLIILPAGPRGTALRGACP